jgi:hypothetical protein
MPDEGTPRIAGICARDGRKAGIRAPRAIHRRLGLGPRYPGSAYWRPMAGRVAPGRPTCSGAPGTRGCSTSSSDETPSPYPGVGTYVSPARAWNRRNGTRCALLAVQPRGGKRVLEVHPCPRCRSRVPRAGSVRRPFRPRQSGRRGRTVPPIRASSAKRPTNRPAATPRHSMFQRDPWVGPPLSLATMARCIAGCAGGGEIGTSTDAGATWLHRTSDLGTRYWTGIASAADGMKLVAASPQWLGAIAPPADGMVIAAGAQAGDISISMDGGATWAVSSGALSAVGVPFELHVFSRDPRGLTAPMHPPGRRST